VKEMSETYKELIEREIGSKWFASNSIEKDGKTIPPMAQDNPRRIVLALVREIIGPFINRSEDPDETISIKIKGNRDVIEIPARKFKSKEKLLGIRLCKAFNTIDFDYEYNDIKNSEMLKNPNSALFGDTLVESGRGNQAMLPSRVLYSSSYSIRPRIDLTRKLTHNALSGQGTMWDRNEGENRKSLFETEYIIPGAVFPSFITLKDPTPELLYHFIMTLRETSYGAQTSITGSNVKNHIVAVLACGIEPPITSYTVSEHFSDRYKEINSSNVLKTVTDYIDEEFRKYAKETQSKFLDSSKTKEFVNSITSLDEKNVSDIYAKLREDSELLWNYSGFSKKEKTIKGKQGGT